MALVSLVASPLANSYVTAAELHAYMGVIDAGWATVAPVEQERLAILATMEIDRVRFLGSKALGNQRLEFPRVGDPRVFRPILDSAPQVDKSASGFAYGLTRAFEETFPASANLTLACFPARGSVRISTFLGGVVTEIDDGAGALGAVGAVDYAAGTITLTGVPTAPVVVQYDGVRRDVLICPDAQMDPGRFMPDFLVGGSVHVLRADGVREFFGIAGHNIVSGEITLDQPMADALAPGDRVMLFWPVHDDLKRAVMIQVAARRGLVTLDTRAGRGIKSIKIGDTATTYSDAVSSSRVTSLAAKFGLNDQSFALIARFTIYGKGLMVEAMSSARTA